MLYKSSLFVQLSFVFYVQCDNYYTSTNLFEKPELKMFSLNFNLE